MRTATLLNKLTFCLILILSLLSPGCTRARSKTPQFSPTQNANVAETSYAVPPQLQELYDRIDKKLEYLDGYLNKKLSGTQYDVIYGAELLPANGNQGEKLLEEKTYDTTLLYLDQLQSLGVKGVKVAMSYPLLTSDFPDYEGYLAFYKKVGEELRRRNMTLLAGVGPVFANTVFSDLRIDYVPIPFARYKRGLRQQVETIIREIQPDYITIANEPITLGWLTGLKLSAADFAEMAEYVLSELDKGGALVGAGAGSWDDIAYIKRLTEVADLDYIDIHIYPINLDFFEKTLTIADIAVAAGKRLIIGEAWLYKIDDREIARTGALATQAEVFSRDAFGFWEPLDIRFIELVDRLARHKHFEFVSFFWAKSFFAYLDYEKTEAYLTYPELVSLANIEAVNNMLSNKVTMTGLTYKTLASKQ